MGALPFQKWYWADYFAKTTHLTPLENSAYLTLIGTYWQRGKPLIDDDGVLARSARMTTEEWLQAKAAVAEFFVIADGLWRHERVDADLDSSRKKVAQTKAAGKASGRSRGSERSNERSNDRSNDISNDRANGEVNGENLDDLIAEARSNRPFASGANPPFLNERSNDRSSERSNGRSNDRSNGERTSQKSESESSVPPDGGTARRAPRAANFPNIADFFFHPDVIALVVGGGLESRKARSFIGGLRKTGGDVAAAAAIERCFDERPSDPLAWLRGAVVNREWQKGTFASGSYGQGGKL